MQFDFFLKPDKKSSPKDFLTIGSREIPLVLVRNRRARRYVLRLRSDGTARVTVPRGGSNSDARRFAERNSAWLEQQLRRLAERPKRRENWSQGTEFYFRGELVKIETGTNGNSTYQPVEKLWTPPFHPKSGADEAQRRSLQCAIAHSVNQGIRLAGLGKPISFMDLRLRSNEVAARFSMKPSGLRSFWLCALSLLGHRSIGDMLPRRFAHKTKNPLSGGIHSFSTGCYVRFGSEQIEMPRLAPDLRPAIEKHLWHLAANEFPSKVSEYAAIHQLKVNRITVRGQKSRWGSCSRRGTISLNWRLIQTPEFVRDYIILHELMHLRQMNHSARYWEEVERVCPDYHLAEKWLKQHSALQWL